MRQTYYYPEHKVAYLRIERDWLGVPMYFSGYGVDENRAFVEGAGLDVERAQVETVVEAGEPVRFLWVVARKPGGERLGGSS